MNVKPKFVYYDIRRKQSVSLIMYTHENDVDTQVLEVSMLDNGEPIELDTNYTYSAAIVNRDTKALINDNISCTLNESGNVLIPIDNFHTLGAQDLLIELTITDSAGDQVLVTPFPLWIHVNASILDDAQVTPESQGTVPELLEEAREAAESATQAAEAATEAISTKQDKLTAGQNITITKENVISASSGSNDYTDLTNKPSINNVTLSGNKSSDDLSLQGKLTAGNNITIENNVISAEGGGGAQIVSGEVNANGTITFTDSEGDSFTTSGESVIGADGFSPTATITQTQSGATVTITDKNGTTTANISNGAPGQDYVLTAQDKDDIADIVLAEFTGSIVNGELNTR